MKWFIISVGVGTIVLAVFFTQFSTEAKSEKESEIFVPNDNTRQNVETYWQIMRAAAYESVTSDKADDYKEDMEWFASFVQERSQRYGELQSIDFPMYRSPAEAAIVVRFEKNTYVFNLAIDSNGEIASINLANFAPEGTLSKLTWEELGDDTLRATVLTNLSVLKEAFERDKGKVRLVSILSPT